MIVNTPGYAVAYLDQDGEGFSQMEPWILDSPSLEQCKRDASDLILRGYPKVICFKYETINSEGITWDYVDKNKVNK